MLTDVLNALQDAALVGALRRSHWVYPIVNTGHIVGLALLFGAIVPLDLRLIGLWPMVSIGSLARMLLPVAIAGLVARRPDRRPAVLGQRRQVRRRRRCSRSSSC